MNARNFFTALLVAAYFGKSGALPRKSDIATYF